MRRWDGTHESCTKRPTTEGCHPHHSPLTPLRISFVNNVRDFDCVTTSWGCQGRWWWLILLQILKGWVDQWYLIATKAVEVGRDYFEQSAPFVWQIQTCFNRSDLLKLNYLFFKRSATDLLKLVLSLILRHQLSTTHPQWRTSCRLNECYVNTRWPFRNSKL